MSFWSSIPTSWKSGLSIRPLRGLESCSGVEAAKFASCTFPPGRAKVGLDDFLAAGNTVEDLLARATRELRQPPGPASELPTIHLGGRLSELTKEALQVLRQTNAAAPRIFHQGGALVRLRLDDEGMPHA